MSNEYIPENSEKMFYIPKTLASDYDNFLENDIPNTVMDFELIPDWYAQFDSGYEKRYIRGVIYSDKSKSRYSNTDNNINFRASASSGIKKGDIIKDERGGIYVFDWEVQLQANNAPTRALRCNTMLTFKRHVSETVDQDGYLVEPERTEIIADRIPSNAYRYDGRPEYTATMGTPGSVPNAITILTVQYNARTAQIDIDDQFTWGNAVHYVVDINYVGLNVTGTSGVIVLQAKKVAGGES